MADWPKTLGDNNAAVVALRDWLKGQLKAAREALETETDVPEIWRLQGRSALLRDLLRNVDPKHRRYGSEA